MESKCYFFNFSREIAMEPTYFHEFFTEIRTENHVKNNTFAIFPAVTKSTEKHLIYVLIYDGIAENDHLFATGYFAAKGSRVPMSFKGTEGLTLEKNDSCVQNVTRNSCEAIIYPNTSKRIKRELQAG